MTSYLDTKTPTLGLGCWAIGGPFTAGGRAVGWGVVDDAVSTRAIHTAIDHSVCLFDSAQAYGAGHSEVVLMHLNDMDIATAAPIFDELDRMRAEGAIGG